MSLYVNFDPDSEAAGEVFKKIIDAVVRNIGRENLFTLEQLRSAHPELAEMPAEWVKLHLDTLTDWCFFFKVEDNYNTYYKWCYEPKK